MQMRLCNRCNQWGETAEPYTCTDELIEADQDIAELKEVNGRLQYQNDRLAAKVQKLELAEKMAREARARTVAAEQRVAQAEREAVRECERIARENRLKYQAYNDDRLLIVGCDGIIRNRYPQHFEGE